MQTITYENIKVEGAPIQRILHLEIKHKSNEHGQAVVIGEADIAAAQEYANRVNGKSTVTIKTSAKGQPAVLFVGSVSNAGIQKQGTYARITLKLSSTSIFLDSKRNNKSFQRTGMSYEEVIKSAIQGEADITMQVSDKPIGSIIMQYNETNWEFTKRMAAVFGAPVITNLTTKKPHITIGLPTGAKTYQASDIETASGMDEERYAGLAASQGTENMMQKDFMGTSIDSYQYVFLGDKISYGGNTQKVQGVYSTLHSGILKTTISVAAKGGFAQPQKVNGQVSGKMFSGTVQAVKRDMVQVHLTDIDSAYDAGGDYWFPYSTAYSSNDGSGFYCMPAEGDTVRVFFPSGKEGSAFAASSVSVSPLDNPKHKRWRTPGGKEILFTEEGIFITCKENKIFINLTDEDGITIQSDKDINICAANNVLVMGNKDVVVEAENNILISTAQSYIDIKKEGIEIGAENVLIN